MRASSSTCSAITLVPGSRCNRSAVSSAASDAPEKSTGTRIVQTPSMVLPRSSAAAGGSGRHRPVSCRKGRGAAADRVALGLVLHSPTDRLIRVYSVPATQPQFVILQNEAQILGYFVGTSVKVHRDWEVGAGLRLSANVKANVTIVSDEKRLDE